MARRLMVTPLLLVAVCVISLTVTGCGASSTAPEAAPCPEATNWTDADSVEGESGEIVGPVISTSYRPDVKGEPTFLNVGADYPKSSRFTVVIWGEDRGNFPTEPESDFDQETICVNGDVFDYRGVSEIAVSDPSQIEISP